MYFAISVSYMCYSTTTFMTEPAQFGSARLLPYSARRLNEPLKPARLDPEPSRLILPLLFDRLRCLPAPQAINFKILTVFKTNFLTSSLHSPIPPITPRSQFFKGVQKFGRGGGGSC